MRDFEWSELGDNAWNLKCNICGTKYWKFKGKDKRLFEWSIPEDMSHKIGDQLTPFERQTMFDTFDGRIICPDCEHNPLVGQFGHDIITLASCSQCGSKFSYGYSKSDIVIRLNNRMPNRSQEPDLGSTPAPIGPEQDQGFLLEGSL
jgi:ribosomal protein S27E